MSDTNLIKGWSRNKRIRLPEEITTLDPKCPIGGAVTAGLIKAVKTGDYENVGNMMTFAEAAKIQSADTNEPIVTHRQETYVLSKDGKTTEVSSVQAMDSLVAQGWLFTDSYLKEFTG